MSAETPSKAFQCTLCERRFLNSGNLKQHMEMHTGNFSHWCRVCHMGFPAASHLVKHMRIHTGQKPYGCAICENRFVEANAVKKHLKTHAGTGPSFKCIACQLDFVRITALQQHLKSHMGGTFLCVVCQNGFLHPGHATETDMICVYKEDKKTRKDPSRPYVCAICKRRFATSGDHKRHCKIHIGKEPYACSVCYNRFIKKDVDSGQV